jgi:hypothetical protein
MVLGSYFLPKIILIANKKVKVSPTPGIAATQSCYKGPGHPSVVVQHQPRLQASKWPGHSLYILGLLAHPRRYPSPRHLFTTISQHASAYRHIARAVAF